MAEALAERLLDLHCRLLSLYVLQDADSLHWENSRPFFEGERGSVTVQMWWLYMQGLFLSSRSRSRHCTGHSWSNLNELGEKW